MKHLLSGIAIFFVLVFSSCSNTNDDSQTSTLLEGVWRLQNIPGGAILTFQGSNWTLNSGTVIITGTFTLTGNTMNGVAVSRSGTSSNLLQPNTFTGDVSISNNKATFTNFSGNWRAPFSSWYQKQ